MVSMKQIAEELNISRCTVSNILNNKVGKYSYKKETIQRVLAMAEQMGYVPNILAQSLKTGTTKMIALIVPDVANPFYIRIIKTVERYAYLSGYNLSIYASEERIEKEESILYSLQTRRIDGVLISPVSFVNSLKGKYPYPIVCFDRRVATDDYSTVEINNEAIAFEAMTNLIRKGCKQTLFLGGSAEDSTIIQRLKGVDRALKNAGLPCEKEKRLLGIFDDDAAYSLILRVTKDFGIRFDSIMLSTNYFLFGVMKALQENNLDSIQVSGFEKYQGYDFVFKNVEIVNQPEEKIGIAAFNCLLNQLRSGLTERKQNVINASIITG